MFSRLAPILVLLVLAAIVVVLIAPSVDLSPAAGLEFKQLVTMLLLVVAALVALPSLVRLVIVQMAEVMVLHPPSRSPSRAHSELRC